MYDLAFGPPNPHPPRTHRIREWEDPFAWVDLLVSAPAQVAFNVKTNQLTTRSPSLCKCEKHKAARAMHPETYGELLKKAARTVARSAVQR